MKCDIATDFPRELRNKEGIRLLLEVIEEYYCRQLQEVELIPEYVLDPKQIPIFWLPLKLDDWGFSLGKLELTEDQQRKLLSGILPIIYEQKGTLLGIVNLIRLLLGIEVTANIKSVSAEEIWIINHSQINQNTRIGSSDPASFLLIESVQDLTQEQVDNILVVVNFMRVGGTEVLLDYPNKEIVVEEYWIIGKPGHTIGSKKITGIIKDKTYEGNYPYPGTRRQETGFIN